MYDALNVLMAMDIITKEKKNIRWRGLPTNTEQEGARLQVGHARRARRRCGCVWVGVCGAAAAAMLLWTARQPS